MGTALGIPTRRYHGLLVASLAPPVQREMLLHSLVESLVLDVGTPRERAIDLSSYRFRAGDGAVDHPRGYRHCVSFEKGLSCRWLFRVEDAEVVKTLHLYRGRSAIAVEYALRPGPGMVRLNVRPLIAMRDAHSMLHHRDFHAEPQARRCAVSRAGRTLELASDLACFDVDHQWWNGFEYQVEKDRGYDHQEDLFSPGIFVLQTRPGREQRITIKAWFGEEPGPWADDERARTTRLIALTRATLAEASDSPAADDDRTAVAALVAAADDFIVQRGEHGVSVIAGYPWFSDWGRDTMISLPGLLLSTRRFAEARTVLETFAKSRRNGLIPNLFNDRTGEAEYNTVDASLWFVHAACEYARASGDRAGFAASLQSACTDIIDAYQRGTDFGIRMDPADGLIAAGDETTQLTWMDAKRDGTVFTPRHGKAVEINALWHHALVSLADAIQAADPARAAAFRKSAAIAARSFRAKFWNKAAGCCYDVLVPAGKAWTPDARIRPNQVFAASLEHSPLTTDQRASVLRVIRDRLLTPGGLRTLDPADPGFIGRYRGAMWERDAAYHNGTAWPWLLGAYAEGLLRAGSFSAESRKAAREALLPLVRALDGQSMGQLPEVYDGEHTPDHPQHPGGCPAQAWSVAETLRAWLMMRAAPTSPDPRR
jgi:predicted glycogen debranching enzyme